MEVTNGNGNGNGEKKWRKWLFNEISLFTGVIAIVISIMFWIQNPVAALKEEINEIELEHSTIRAEIIAVKVKTSELENNLSVKLIALQVQLDRVEARQIEVLKGMAQLQAIHR